MNELPLAELVHNITAAATQKPNLAITSAILFDDIIFLPFNPDAYKKLDERRQDTCGPQEACQGILFIVSPRKL